MVTESYFADASFAPTDLATAPTSMFKIAIVGPESSGKTTLTEALAQHYGCLYTAEFARIYLADKGPGYVEEDLLHIAHGQLLKEREMQQLAHDRRNGLLVCDTDLLTIRIWSEEVYGRSAPELLTLSQHHHYDHWMLCRPDIPWEPDPLRENPHDRDRLFEVYEAMLKKLAKPYTILEGPLGDRLRKAIAAIDMRER